MMHVLCIHPNHNYKMRRVPLEFLCAERRKQLFLLRFLKMILFKRRLYATKNLESLIRFRSELTFSINNHAFSSSSY